MLNGADTVPDPSSISGQKLREPENIWYLFVDAEENLRNVGTECSCHTYHPEEGHVK